jgi:hypothetical protein
MATASKCFDWVETDGGRSAAGFSGKDAGDCVARAIALAAGLPYRKVYEDLAAMTAACRIGERASARDGVSKAVWQAYIEAMGWQKQPVEKVEDLMGRRRQPRPRDLPHGTFIARQANHLVCVKNCVVHDAWDSSERMVYAAWKLTGKPSPAALPRDEYEAAQFCYRRLSAADQRAFVRWIERQTQGD